MWDKDEIAMSYRTAKNKAEQIFILSELTASDIDTIIEVLQDAGETIPRKILGMKRCLDCGLRIPNGRCKRCKSCSAKHDYQMRKIRYQKNREKKMLKENNIQERGNGFWKKETDKDGNESCVCSVCGHINMAKCGYMDNYCSNCGADMREKQ